MTEEIVHVPETHVKLGMLDVAPEQVVNRATMIANALADVIRKKGLSSKIKGKEYVRVEGWSTLGAMIGVLPREQHVKEIENGYEAYVDLVRASDGVVIGGASAICTRDERNWKDRDAFAVRSMAITRATGKAYRLGMAWIMELAGYAGTPAEEMYGIFDEDVVEGTVKEVKPKKPKKKTQLEKDTDALYGVESQSKPREKKSGPDTHLRVPNQWESEITKAALELKVVQAIPHAVNILNKSPFYETVPYGELETIDGLAFICAWQALKRELPDEDSDFREKSLAGSWQDEAVRDKWRGQAADLLAEK